jgi:pyruvate/2-oxoglutarate/acetoin dehydrogenase E1 component
MTRNGTGDYTITFGANFRSAPVVTANPIDATFATTEVHSVTVESVSTASAAFTVVTTTTNGTATDILSAAADIDFNFVIIGSRDR